MDFQTLLGQLSHLSPHELSYLSHRCQDLLSSEERVTSIKKSLYPGLKIRYFNSKLNCEVPATVDSIGSSWIIVTQLKDGQKFRIRPWVINPTDLPLPTFRCRSALLSREHLKVGDSVGFEHNGRSLIGEILKLNPKTAKLLTTKQGTWKVAYSHLFPVIEGRAQSEKSVYLEGTVIDVVPG